VSDTIDCLGLEIEELQRENAQLKEELATVIEECKDLRVENQRLYKRLIRLEEAGVLWADAASVRLSRE